ncbi:hypothetical protein [Streptomyces sp. NPDC015350]|uniref:hypothetical protein n=1 Tax=Streptomyces sp. NPDC015350 TaxID=3364955 RepID=UPI0037029290
MAAAPVVAATSGLLVPGEAAAASNGVTATPAEHPMGLTYDAAHSALLEESISGLRSKEGRGRTDVAGVLRGSLRHRGRKLWELPKTPEDLSCQGITRNAGRVWGLTEGRERRFVFGMRVSR